MLELAFNFRFRERLQLFMFQFRKTRGPHILASASQSSTVTSVGSPSDDIRDLDDIFAQSSDWVDPQGNLVEVGALTPQATNQPAHGLRQKRLITI